jgi:hypothetical protein
VAMTSSLTAASARMISARTLIPISTQPVVLKHTYLTKTISRRRVAIGWKHPNDSGDEWAAHVNNALTLRSL